jgi:hypothetical protein
MVGLPGIHGDKDAIGYRSAKDEQKAKQKQTPHRINIKLQSKFTTLG